MLPGVAAAKVPTTNTLKIDIEASIGERCGIAAVGADSKDGGRIDVATSVSFQFRLDCNTPFRIGVAAEQGALQLVETGGVAATRPGDRTPEGFATRKAYVANLQFATDQDGMVDAGECDSDELTSRRGGCGFFGNRPGTGFSAGRDSTAIGREGALTVRWRGEDADSVRLAAGTYQEVLTIVVGPRT
ncbi:MAG: hypothetical protein ACT6Q5_06550 [Sphingopyxis solisilvae]|uniref:hypothetical protein n=1 Tax=Sphingopyxis solisilvae TaxID=1886788 RepID=UPI004035138B